MADPSRKRPRDVNQLAAQIVSEAVSEDEAAPSPGTPGRRRSGQAGGKARAEALTPERRQAIGRKAAAARWKKERPQE